MQLTKIFWIIRNKLSENRVISMLLVLAALSISTFLLVKEVQKRQSLSASADTSTAELTIEPSTGNVHDTFLVKVWANTSNPMAFARVELSFDKDKLQLVNDLDVTGSPLTKTIILTKKDVANETGKLTLTAGLDPSIEDPNLPDNFALTILRFRTVPGSTGETTITFGSDTSLVDLTATDYTLTTKSATYTLTSSNEANDQTSRGNENNGQGNGQGNETITDATPTETEAPLPTESPSSMPSESPTPSPEESIPPVADDPTPTPSETPDDSPATLEDPQIDTNTTEGLSIKITSPSNNSTVSTRSRVNITTTTTTAPDSAGIRYVRFYVNGRLRFRDSTSEYRYSFLPWYRRSSTRTFKVTAVVVDKEGRKSRDTVTINSNTSSNWFHFGNR